MVSVGVDYYPEQWSPTLWEKDADDMATIGVKSVRMAEFAWSKIEPTEGNFNFDWLDKAYQIFTTRGISVILCTPTNCPPRWAYDAYPDLMQHSAPNTPITLGIRGHRCYRSPSLLRLSHRIITKMVQRYPAVAWQIDNELDAAPCCCPNCIHAFRSYLREKYHSIEALNQRCGLMVWSGDFTCWEQIMPPTNAYPLGWYHPALTMEWITFCRNTVADFARMQAELIRSIRPDAVITTNTWLCEHVCDLHQLFHPLDVVSFDNYPATRLPAPSHGFHLDMMRGVKQRNFWIMEQLSGPPGCWMPIQRTPKPNMLAGYGMQAIAHGADHVVFFRWRSALQGAEMFWHGILDHSGIHGRRYREFSAFCHAVNQLEIPEDATISNDVAILMSFSQEAAISLQPQADGYHYYDQLKVWHHALTALGCGCDIISEHADFSSYQLVIAPCLFLADPDTTMRLHAFAAAGGTVILTQRCGVQNLDHACIMAPLPCGYADLTGCTVDEYDALGYDTLPVTMQDKHYSVHGWCEALTPTDADVLASYDDGMYAGMPCVTLHAYGEGRCCYVGCIGDDPFHQDLLRHMLALSGVSYVPDLPPQVEITCRKNHEKTFWFIMNCSEHSVHVSLPFWSGMLESAECRVVMVENKEMR